MTGDHIRVRQMAIGSQANSLKATLSTARNAELTIDRVVQKEKVSVSAGRITAEPAGM